MQTGRLWKCLRAVNTLIPEGCSETGALRHSSNHMISESITSEIFKLWRWSFFFDFQNAKRILKKGLYFWRKWRLNLLQELMWIMRRIHATGSQHVTKQWSDFRSDWKEMFSNSICAGLMGKWAKSGAAEVAAAFASREHLDSGTVFWKKSFRAFK